MRNSIVSRARTITLLTLVLWLTACFPALSHATAALGRYAVADVVDSVSPAVVSVNTVSLGVDQSEVPGVGSGVIVGDNLVLTNFHVIDQAAEITVTLADETIITDVQVVGSDPLSDLAVLRLAPPSGQDLPKVELGDSDELRVGELVVAVGNPFAFQLGASFTVTMGIISAKERTIETETGVFQHFLQTDAAINPGNSGGPLADLDGKIIGINTAIIPYAQGIGFAIPINHAKEVMRQLLAEGRVSHPWLGAIVRALSSAESRSQGLEPGQGVHVEAVARGSEVDQAGLKPGDIILEVNRKPVANGRDLFLAVETLEVGEKIFLEVLRDGSRRFLVTQIEERS